jgi:hypothetical protein
MSFTKIFIYEGISVQRCIVYLPFQFAPLVTAPGRRLSLAEQSPEGTSVAITKYVELTIDGDESTGPQKFDSIKTSPKSQAIQLKEMRIEHSSSAVDSRIAEVEKQLNSLKTSSENSSDPNGWADQFGKTVSELQATLPNLIFKKSRNPIWNIGSNHTLRLQK